jgi:outer membrane lipopolysaccharide assembly protein LptE/RlpB
MTVTYVVTNLQEKKIIDTNKISTEEVYEFSQENILASWEEEQKVKSDLIENLLLQLFRKLNFLLN